MDFGSLLYAAKRNENSLKNEQVRCYKATFDPPKKEQKSKSQLSTNIQKFLARKEQEEKKKAVEAKKKKDELLALRSQDGKAKKRVAAMLNRTKAANKSAIEDAVDNENTAVTLGGLAQPDEDDYGYVSQEASAFYTKLMEKYSSTPSEEPKFSKKPKSGADALSNTKDRVKMALLREEEEQMMPHKRKRKTKEEKLKESEGGEKSQIAQEREECEEEKPSGKPAKPHRPPAPPPIDFRSLLQLAEKKQFEPIKFEPKVKDEDEDQRPMTKKQRAEYMKMKEWRMRKEGKLPPLPVNVQSPPAENRGRDQKGNRPVVDTSKDERNSRPLDQRNSSKEQTSLPSDVHREKPSSRPSIDSYREQPKSAEGHRKKISSRPSIDSCREQFSSQSADAYREKPSSRPYADSYREHSGNKSAGGYSEKMSSRSSTDGYREQLNSRSADSYREKTGSRLSVNSNREHSGNKSAGGYSEKMSSRSSTDGYREELNSRSADTCREKTGSRLSVNSNREKCNNRSTDDYRQKSDSRVVSSSDRVSVSGIKDRPVESSNRSSTSGKLSIPKVQSKSREENSQPRIPKFNGGGSAKLQGNSDNKVGKERSREEICSSSLDKVPVKNNQMPSSSASGRSTNLSGYSKKLQESLLAKLQEKESQFRVPEAPVSKVHKNRDSDVNKESRISKEIQKRVCPPGKSPAKPQGSSQRPAEPGRGAVFQESSLKHKQLPSKDAQGRQPLSKDIKPRQFPPADVRSRQFPPADVRRKPKPPPKRRIEDSDEYDSELDDFIDDGPEEEEDYSKHIKEIFGYDKSRYRIVDDDDECMESSFSQQLKEEFVSTKMGILEDLEDMEMEKRQLAARKGKLMEMVKAKRKRKL